MNKQKRAITLIELLIAISLVGVLAIGISSVDTYTHFHLMSSDRRAQIQNEASYVLEHIAKNITGTANSGGAIGDYGLLPVTIQTWASNATIIMVRRDLDQDGRLDPLVDDFIGYFYTSDAVAGREYEVWYCPGCDGTVFSCGRWTAASDLIGRRIRSVTWNYDNIDTAGDPIDNFIEVEITACWDPTQAGFQCGEIDNPAVTMRNRINMPAVSVN